MSSQRAYAATALGALLQRRFISLWLARSASVPKATCSTQGVPINSSVIRQAPFHSRCRASKHAAPLLIRYLSTPSSAAPTPGPATVKVALPATSKGHRKRFKIDWTPEDDKLLRDLRLHHGKKWLEIGQALDRAPATCMTRFESTLNPELKEFWTAERDRTLDVLVSRSTSWPDIASELGVHRLACVERWRQLGLRDIVADTSAVPDPSATSSAEIATKRRKKREQSKPEQGSQDFPNQDILKGMREMVGSLRAVGPVDKDSDHQGWNALLKDEQRYEQHRSWKRKSRLDAFSQLYLMNPGWSAKEETILIQFVLKNGLGQWERVAKEHLGGRFTPNQCRTCWKNLDMPVVASLESNALHPEAHKGNPQHRDSIKNEMTENEQGVLPAQMRAPDKGDSVLSSEDGAKSRRQAFIWDKELSVRLQVVVLQAYKSRAIPIEEVNWLWVSTKVHPDATSRICKNHWKFLHPEYSPVNTPSASSHASVKVWTHEDVRRLEEGIRLVGPRKLKTIRDHFLPHMTKDDIMRQWFRISDKATIIDEEEYYRLLGAVEKVVFGINREGSGAILDRDPQSQDWIEVKRIMGSGWERMPCKRVWESSFQHLIRRTVWSAKEDNTLLRMVKFVGRDDWFTVAKAIQMGRTAWQCRLRWCQLLDPVQLDTSDLYVDGERYD
ncbi:hypothetical protein EC968_006352 [Mortierella alpina]|nr:hypothetical protein EC968_006352 [Mortierella alpina]